MLGPLRIMEWAEVRWSKGWQKHHKSKLKPWEPHTSLFFALEFEGTLPEMTRKEIGWGVNGKIHNTTDPSLATVSESTEFNQPLMKNIWEKIPEIPKSNT